MRIELQNLSFSYGEKPIFRDFSLVLPEKGILAVTGPSGCGKTTLLRLLCRLLTPDSGKILFPKPFRPSYIFQEDRLLPWSSARENLDLVTGDPAVSEEWLTRVGLDGWGETKPAELSGGMRRRVAIARALAYPGNLLLMDEPLKGLDHALKARSMELLTEKCREIPGVLVTHDREEAEALAVERLEL